MLSLSHMKKIPVLSKSKPLLVLEFIWHKSLTKNVTENSATYEAHTKSKYMQKLMFKKGPKTKKRWFEPHIAEPLEYHSKQKAKDPSLAKKMRANQLSHILYDKVTHLINSGELSIEIMAKQIFISSVKMLPNMNGISVYWRSDRDDCEEIEHLLQSHQKKLRALLISYHVLGKIPPLTFIRDKNKSNMGQLNRLFDVADYGPDYVPSHLRKANDNTDCGEVSNRNAYETEDVNVYDKTSLNLLGDQKLMHIANSSSENGALQTAPVVDDMNFQSNVYGLNRDSLMKKVLAKRDKTYEPEGDFEGTENSQLNIQLFEKSRMMVKQRHKVRKAHSLKSRLLERDGDEF